MPFPLPDPQGYCWAAFQEIVAADQVTGLINAYLALDVVFAVVIGALLYRALRTACRIECAPRPGWLPFLATPNTRLAFYVVAADICENLPFFVIVALSAGWRSGGDVDAGRAGGGGLCEMAHAVVPREHS
ncbi:MAG: hypothetical protein WBB15_14330 [Ornithinimicrobium sp.]